MREHPWVRIPLSPPFLRPYMYFIRPMRKYPSGRRGSPAKGVDVQTTCEGSNPSFRASSEKALKAMEKAFRAFSIRRTGFFFAFKRDPPFVRPDGGRSWRQSRQHRLGSRLRDGGARGGCVPLVGKGVLFMICPGCGRKMEPGWLRSQGPLQWSTRPPDRLLPVKGQKNVSIWTINEPPAAYICRECEKMIVDFSAQISLT